MKDGGLWKTSQPSSSHLIKPVLNGLSDLLRLPQYPVLGVRAAALTGVRREGELYTRLQGGGKGGGMSPRDAHKSGDNRSLGGFPGPRCQTGPGAGGARARWTRAHGPARPLQFRAGSKGPALIHFLTKRCMFGQPFGRPDRPPAHGPAPPAHAFRPRHLYSPPPSTPVRPSIESFLPPAQPSRQPGPDLWPGP